MNHLKDTFSVSERRAARVVGVSRSTLRYSLRIPDRRSAANPPPSPHLMRSEPKSACI